MGSRPASTNGLPDTPPPLAMCDSVQAAVDLTVSCPTHRHTADIFAYEARGDECGMHRRCCEGADERCCADLAGVSEHRHEGRDGAVGLQHTTPWEAPGSGGGQYVCRSALYSSSTQPSGIPTDIGPRMGSELRLPGTCSTVRSSGPSAAMLPRTQHACSIRASERQGSTNVMR